MTNAEPGRLAGRPRVSREPLARTDRYIIGLLAALLGTTLIGFVTISRQLVDMQRQIGDLRTELREGIGGPRAEASNTRDPAGP